MCFNKKKKKERKMSSIIIFTPINENSENSEYSENSNFDIDEYQIIIKKNNTNDFNYLNTLNELKLSLIL
jgi:hypothetical protein